MLNEEEHKKLQIELENKILVLKHLAETELKKLNPSELKQKLILQEKIRRIDEDLAGLSELALKLLIIDPEKPFEQYTQKELNQVQTTINKHLIFYVRTA